jgi:sec-independent protein translocase protein TatC
MKIIEHFKEFRKRLINVIIVFFLLFTIGYIFSSKIINFIVKTLPFNIRLVSTYPLEIFNSQIKVALYCSFLFIIPYLILHLIQFINPALRKKEMKILRIIPLGLFLFYFGFIFGFFAIYLFGIYFLSNLSIGMNIGNLWSLEKTISFLFMICIILGLCFQFPLLIVILNKLNIIDKKFLKNKRKSFFLAILIFVAVITPTVDPVTMLIVTIPLILLYELSLWLIKLF